jgi:hypothetical protein
LRVFVEPADEVEAAVIVKEGKDERGGKDVVDDVLEGP